jgi:hypothetical protein
MHTDNKCDIHCAASLFLSPTGVGNGFMNKRMTTLKVNYPFRPYMQGQTTAGIPETWWSKVKPNRNKVHICTTLKRQLPFV